MTTLRISITAEVLEATKDCGCTNDELNSGCAITYAVRDIWPKAIVGIYFIMPFGMGAGQRSIKFIHQMDAFTMDFDRATPSQRAAMQPFSFDIEVPDEVIREVNIEEIRRICEGSKTLELVS